MLSTYIFIIYLCFATKALRQKPACRQTGMHKENSLCCLMSLWLSGYFFHCSSANLKYCCVTILNKTRTGKKNKNYYFSQDHYKLF